MEGVVSDHAAGHLISLINDQMMPQTPFSLDQNQHLKLPMNDIESPASGFVTPSTQHVEQLIKYALQWDQLNPLVIHCWAGISRSTAAAFIALCALNPHQDELHIARSIRNKSVTATPNSLLVSCADQVLGRSGQMINAIEAIGRGAIASAGLPFSMPAIMGKSDAVAREK
ncbi:MAG: tyrosine protein phosphatase [bacterium]|nr:tyrosine protein phosphatase [bacterium]